MHDVQLKYVSLNSVDYKKAVALRVALFFNDAKYSFDVIQDDFETQGIHLVCLISNAVVGTARLNIKHDTAIISQMAIQETFQKQGIGSKVLNELLLLCNKKHIFKIELAARETAMAFYKKFGFKAFGKKYPSKKTGVIHQNMMLIID